MQVSHLTWNLLANLKMSKWQICFNDFSATLNIGKGLSAVSQSTSGAAFIPFFMVLPAFCCFFFLASAQGKGQQHNYDMGCTPRYQRHK